MIFTKKINYSFERLEAISDIANNIFTTNQSELKAIEEFHELKDAINSNDVDDIKEELVDNLIVNFRLTKIHLGHYIKPVIYYGLARNTINDAKELLIEKGSYFILSIENDKLQDINASNYVGQLLIVIGLLFESDRELHIMLNKKLNKFESNYLKVEL